MVLCDMTKKQPRPQKHIPQRTCIACRQKFDKRQLTRLVRTADEGVVVDPTGTRNGRGAYVCNQPACWDKILRKSGLLDQALKTTLTPLEVEALVAHKPALAD
jgi:predicted RNA-binding protein YlxR (DUF448 family)